MGLTEPGIPTPCRVHDLAPTAGPLLPPRDGVQIAGCIAQGEAQLKALQAEAEVEARGVQAAREARDGVMQALGVARAELAGLESEVEGKKAERDGLERELERLRGEGTALRAGVADTSAALASLDARLAEKESAHGALAEAAEELAVSRRRIEELEARVQELVDQARESHVGGSPRRGFAKEVCAEQATLRRGAGFDEGHLSSPSASPCSDGRVREQGSAGDGPAPGERTPQGAGRPEPRPVAAATDAERASVARQLAAMRGTAHSLTRALILLMQTPAARQLDPEPAAQLRRLLGGLPAGLDLP